MLVQITLDKPHPTFTNLDIISGRVFLRSSHSSSISSIVVKLEGESRTRLLAPVRLDRDDKQRPVLELHKILYKTQVVFPPPDLQRQVEGSTSFTLSAGQYEYPFQFKIPINNSCNANPATHLRFPGLALELAQAPLRHVKQTLPPSLNGFPGEAEIRYYVKVTVNRPQLFKENPRAWSNFTFLPIEPPRASTAGETYARRQHQFLPPSAQGVEKKTLFGRLSKNVPSLDTASSGLVSKIPPRFSIDARLPNPAILTCNDDIPLRILVKQLSERTQNVYLQILHIELIGYTRVQAHEVQRTETSSWVILSMSNMAIPLGSPTDSVGTEIPINREYWYGRTLPNTVAPTFTTCNISRTYELEVRVGLGYGSYKHGEDQLVVLPLRLPVQVFSGIKPPAALLEATIHPEKQPSEKPGLAPPQPAAQDYHQVPPSPLGPPSHTYQHSPARRGTAVQGTPQAQSAPGYEDAPPSYEDAIAQELPPVEGPRREYAPPPFPEGDPGLSSRDEKRRSL